MANERARQAELVEELLASRGWKPAVLARTIGVTASTVSRWRSGSQQISDHHAERLDLLWPEPTRRAFRTGERARPPGTAKPPAAPASDGEIVRVLHDAAAVYRAAIELLASATDAHDRSVDIVSTLGLSGEVFDVDPLADPSLSALQAEFRAALRARIRDGWRVRQLYNCPSAGELGIIDAALAAVGPYYSIRTYALRETVMNLAPLVIGRRHAFLATADVRQFRIDTAAYGTDHHWVEWVREVFEFSWQRAPMQLRDHRGVDETAVAALRARIT